MLRLTQPATLLLALGLIAGVAAAAPGLRATQSADLRQVEADQQEREQARDAARAQAGPRGWRSRSCRRNSTPWTRPAEGRRRGGEKRLKLAALNVRENASTPASAATRPSWPGCWAPLS